MAFDPTKPIAITLVSEDDDIPPYVFRPSEYKEGINDAWVHAELLKDNNPGSKIVVLYAHEITTERPDEYLKSLLET